MAIESAPGRLGWVAADFALADAHGERHDLAGLRGPNGLLVMFICNHCPYVQGILDRICRDARDLQALGYGVVAVMSNDVAAYPDDAPDKMAVLAAEHDFTFPYLFDASQNVARAYDAVCTPDFFGFDRDLRLLYRGRLDSCGKHPATPDLHRELFDALRQVAAGETAPAAQRPSIGCSIKWRQDA